MYKKKIIVRCQSVYRKEWIWQGIREQKRSVMTWDFSIGVGYFRKGTGGEEVSTLCDHYFIAGKNTMHQLQVKVDAATQEVRRVCCPRGNFLSAIAQTLSSISQRQFPFLTLWPTPLVALEKSLLSGPQCSQIRVKCKVGWSSRFPQLGILCSYFHPKLYSFLIFPWTTGCLILIFDLCLFRRALRGLCRWVSPQN